MMGVPMAFRRVEPGAADLALAVVDAFEDPRLIDAHMCIKPQLHFRKRSHWILTLRPRR